MINSEDILNLRMELLKLRKPSWVIRYIWVLPVLTGLILLVTQGYRQVTTILVVLVCIQVIYSLFTYFSWKNWSSNQDSGTSRSIIIIMINDGFMMSLFSLLFLVAAILSFKWIDPAWVNPVSLYSTILYLLLSVFVLINGRRITKYIVEKNKSPLAPPTKIALTIPSLMVGVGVALGAILRTSQFGLILTIGLCFLCAYLLLPFAVIVFYQVVVLLRRAPKQVL
jgi:hypothetical protein